MLNALKASNRKPKVCSRKVWKSLKIDMSTFRQPAPRVLPFRAVPKVFGAGAPNAHTPLSTPGVVQGVADGSVPYHLSMVRCTTFSFRYWLGRELPKLFELLPGPVIVSGNPL